MKKMTVFARQEQLCCAVGGCCSGQLC